MPVIVHTRVGVVREVFGTAVFIAADGSERPVKVGDVVRSGDVILTRQDSIVQIEQNPTAAAAPASDTDRVITALAAGDPNAAPGAGLAGGDGSGLGPGLRVDRINESLTPGTLQTLPTDGDTPTTPVPDDTTAPEDELTGGPGPTLDVDAPDNSSDSTPTISGTTTLPPGRIVTLTVTDADGNTQTFFTTVNADGSFSADVPLPLAEGAYTVVATGSDAIGRVATDSDNGSIVIDAAPPVITVSAPELTDDSTPTLTGSTDAPPGSVVTLTITDAAGTVQTVTAVVGADGTYSANVPAPLADGPYGVVASVTTPGGTASANDNGVVDTTPPAPTITLDAITGDDVLNVAETGQSEITLTGRVGGDARPGDTVTVTIGGQDFLTTVDDDGSFSVIVSGAALAAAVAGGVTASVTSTDAAGNSATASVNRPYTLDAAPVAVDDSLRQPEDGPAGSGDLTPGTPGQDSDPEGGTITVSSVAAGNGTPGPGGVGSAVAGDWGSLVVQADGRYVYTPGAIAQSLGAGETVTDTFSYTIVDALGNTSTAQLTVTLVGANDAAVIGGDVTGRVVEDGVLVSSGVLTVADADAGEAVFRPQTDVAGTYGSFSVDSQGRWSYALDNAADRVQVLMEGEEVTETFTVTSSDGTTREVVVTVVGTDDAAVVSVGTGAVVEDLEPEATGTLTVSDIDSDLPTFVAGTQSGSYGGLALASNGQWRYTLGVAAQALAEGEVVTDVFTVSLSDGSTTTVTITVTGTDDAPVISAGAGSVVEDDRPSTSGRLTATDIDGPAPTFVPGTQNGDWGALVLGSDGRWTYTLATAAQALAQDEVVTEVFTVTLSDGSTTTVTITVTGKDDLPVISSGTSTVIEDTTPTATGTLTASDADNPALAFVAGTQNGSYGALTLVSDGQWSYTLGAAAQALAEGEVVTELFTVTLNDGSTTTVTITVTGTNDPAVIPPVVAALTETNAVLTTGGQLTITDPDSPLSFVPQTAVTGTYGSFTLAADGTWTYATSSAHDEFVAGQVYTDTFTVTSADGTTSTVTINIAGTNDPAVIPPVVVNLTETNAVLTTGGTLAITDPDSPLTFVPQTAAAGTYGSFTLAADGTWTYTASSAHDEFEAGKVYTDTFTVTSADGSTSTVTINITGTNDPGAIVPVVVALTETNAILTTGGTVTTTDPDSPLTFVPQTAVAGTYGSFTLASDGTWTYTASSAHDEFVEGQLYTDVFTVTTADGSTSTVTINITGTNDPAVIPPVVVALTETNAVLTTGGTLTITDPDSPLTFVPQTAAAGTYGSFTLAADGTWTYTASSAHDEFEAGQVYTDTFTVTSADGSTSTVTINITGTNDPAVIPPVVVALTETNAVLTTGGTLTITDPDSPLTFVPQTAAAGTYGSFTLAADGTWTYTASSAHDEFEAGQVYTDTFTVTSADGSTSTVTINITGTNDAAVIPPVVVALTETNAVLTTGGTLTITDPDSPLTFVPQTAAAGTYGSFTLAADGTWTYTASSAHDEFEAGQVYTDTFTVTSADGSTSTVTINITGTNDAAVIPPVVVALTETNAVLTTGGTLTITDPDSPLTFVPQTAAAGTYGSFTLAADGTWTYTASSAHDEFEAGQVYTDTFTVTSADGSTSTVTINITGTNDPAVIPPVVVALTETNAALTTGGTLTITDPDSPLTFVTQTAAAGTYGSFTLASDGTWTYTASSAHDEFEAGQVYTDTFTVTSADGSTSTVTINITGTNDPAVIPPVVVALTETNAVLTTGGTLTITDPDSPLTFVPQTAAAGTYGSFTLASDGTWTYTASSAHDEFEAGQVYTDTFTVTSADGSTSTVTINITGTNDPAEIPPVVVALTETNAVLTTGGTLTITDPDSPLTFVTQTAAAGTYGSFTLAADGTWTYTASSAHDEFEAGQVYTDTFTVTSADGSTSTVTINITGTNDPAVIPPVVVALTETNAVLTTGGTLTITDPDSPLTFVPQTAAAGTYGSFTLAADGTWTYTASSAHDEFEAGQVYTDTFTVTSADGSTSTVTINITGTNDPAVIPPVVVALTETNAVLTTGGTLTITDPDSALTFVPQTAAAGTYGSFTLAADGTWTYTASSAHDEFEAGQVYTDTFTVTSADGSTSTVTINITGTNDPAVIPPVVVALTETNAVLTTGGTLTITDPDSPLTFVPQTAAAGTYGSFTLAADGTWTYTASSAHDEFEAGQVYTDTFTVTSADGSTSTVTINITGTNDPAVIPPVVVALTETNAVLTTGGTLTITDPDSPLTFVPQTAAAGTYGSFTLAADGTWTYTASSAHDEFEAGQVYTDTFTVTSADGSTSTVTINITGTNDPAVIPPVVVALTETNAVLTTGGTLTITDPDSPLTFVPQAASAGTYGSFSLAADGTWTYTASSAHDEFEAGQVYTDTFTVTSADGSTSTVTINITGTNDPAVIPPVVVALTETNAVLTTGGTLTITDPDSPLTFVPQTAAAGTYGSFTLAADGTWTYTASSAHDEFEAGQVYTDTFTVTSADGSTSTVTINIAGTNDPAVIPPVVVNLTETNAVLTTGGTLAISDPDSPLTFDPQTAVAGTYGSFTLAANGSWIYTASSAHDEFEAGQLYTDTFTVTSADGSTSTVTINITGTNDPAVIPPVVVNLTETNAVLTTGGTLTITDPDSPLTFDPQTAVAGTYGSFTLAADGTWTYTASSAHDEFEAGQVYTDTFTVTSADGSTSTVTININGTNDAPTATNDSYTVPEDGSLVLPVLVNDSDIDSAGPLSVQSFTQPTFGRVTLNPDGSFSYRADPDFYNTTRTFATVVDSSLGLPNNVFLIHDEQVANAGDYMIAPPRSLTSNGITTLGRLPDGDFIIRISNGDDFERVVNVVGAGNAPDFVVTIPANSAAILNIGNVASGAVYTASGFGGTATVNNTALTLSTPAETFTYTVSDGQGGTATATVDITVTPTNDAPVARSDNRNLNEDSVNVSGQVIRPTSATSGERNDTDKDGDALTVSGVVAGTTTTPPSGGVGTTIAGSLGTLVLAADGSYTYTPGAGAQALAVGQTATDVFTYAVSDGQGGVASTTLTMRVSGSNDAPVIDLDGDNSSGASGSGYRGSHVGAGPVAIVDSDLRVSDIDSALLQRATVTLTNAQAGDALSAGNLPGGITASLVGNVLTLSGAASPADYALALAAIRFDNTLGAPSTVDRLITVSVSDGNLTSNIATSTISVIDRNDTPVNTVPGAVTALEDTRIAVAGLSVADPDDAGANAGFKLATVELSVSNGTLRLALAGGASISAGANDSAAITLSGTQAAINSTLASLSYIGNRDYVGGDVLVVISRDGLGLTDSDSVQITVNGVNDAPSGTDRTVTIAEDTSYTIGRADFGFVDAAGEGNNFLSAIITAPTGGVLRLNGTIVNGSVEVTPAQLDAGLLVYTPAADVNGNAAASFSFQVRDNGGTANGGQDTDPTPNTVTFDITPVNDAPVLGGGGSSANYIENGAAVPINAGLTLGDVDNGTLASATVSIGSGFQAGADVLALVGSFGNITSSYNAGTGVLSLSSAGATATLAQWQSALRAVTFANSGEDPGNATRSIGFQVNDGQAASNLSNTIGSTVSVTPVNDAPTLVITQPSSPAFTEAAGLGTQGAAVAVFSGVAVGTVEAGQTIQALSFTIGGIKDGLNEVLRLDGTTIALNSVNRSGTTPTNSMAFNVVYSGSTDNATATVTLTKTGGIGAASMQSLLEAITYQNTNLDNPSVGDRPFTITRIQDNGGTANGGVDVRLTNLVSTVRVVGVNDGPVVQNDEPSANAVAGTSTAVTGNAVTGAASGNVADTDPENAVLRIAGLAAGVTEAVLGTTAIAAPVSVKGVYGTLTFNADGSYSYLIDNTDADTLALPGGGRATDVFSYTVTDSGGIGTGGALTDTGQITIQVAGSSTLTSTATPINPLIYGVLGEYFGYNDNRTGQAGDPAYNPAAGSTSRWHADDGRASSSLGGGVGTGGANLESTGDALFVINGRNVAAGGSAVTGTPTRSLDGATDARWIATDFDYGFNPQVNGSLGSNPKATGGSGASALPSGSLRDYIGTDINTLQITGGIGSTTDAVVRTFGYIYQPGGFVDFRVTADDGFTLFLNGVEVAQYSANQSPTLREFIGKELQAGMNLLEMVYWEQGGNARLRVEAKESGTAAGSYTNLLSLDNSALFQPGLQPVLTAGQDIVETATNRVWEIRTGATYNGTTAADTVTGSAARDVIAGNNGDDNVRAGSGADNVAGGNGNDSLVGEAGADVINGDNGNDTLNGGLGSDILSGGTGTDILIGGAGWDRLTGGADADTFRWSVADRGVAAGIAENPAANTTAQFNGVSSNGSRAQDAISDFDARPAASGGDVLDLRDLLSGETAATLDRFLDFNVIGAGGATPITEIRISTAGSFGGGNYSSAVEDQRIVLDGIDIRASLSLPSNASDLLIAQTLIDRAKLLVDA